MQYISQREINKATRNFVLSNNPDTHKHRNAKRTHNYGERAIKMLCIKRTEAANKQPDLMIIT